MKNADAKGVGLMGIERTVWVMGFSRLLFGIMGIIGGLLMLRWGTVQQALKINSVLGSVGPVIFTLVSILGFSHMVGRVESYKLMLIGLGTLLILWGTR